MLGNQCSDTIKVARVLCILFVVYPHFPPFGILSENPSAFEWITWEVGWIFGRTSVPVLSLISGFLLVGTLARRSYLQTLRGKLTTLLIPLVLWNLISMAIETSLGQFTRSATPANWPDLVLGLTRTPYLTPLYFLRDIFVCVALFPIIQWCLQRSALITLGTLFLNACFNIDRYLLINSPILLFFAFGQWWASEKRPLKPPKGGIAKFLFAALVLIAAVNYPVINRALEDPWPRHGAVPGSCFLVGRICGAYLMWHLAFFLSACSIKGLITRYEPIIFFVFCVHPLLTATIWAFARWTGATVGSIGHLIAFALAPITVLCISIPITKAIAMISPRILAILSGGRSATATNARSSGA